MAHTLTFSMPGTIYLHSHKDPPRADWNVVLPAMRYLQAIGKPFIFPDPPRADWNVAGEDKLCLKLRIMKIEIFFLISN